MGILPFFSDCLVSSFQVNVQNMICLMASRIVFCRSYCRHFADQHTKSHAILAKFYGQNEPLSVSFRHRKKKLVFHMMRTTEVAASPFSTHRGARIILYGASGAYFRVLASRILKCKNSLTFQKVRGRCAHLNGFLLERP